MKKVLVKALRLIQTAYPYAVLMTVAGLAVAANSSRRAQTDDPSAIRDTPAWIEQKEIKLP